MIASFTGLTLQPAAPPAGSPAGNPLQTACGGQGGFFVPMIMIFVVFYFMLIRPQQKKQREQDQWLKALKKGDEVVTSGGLLGKISGMTDTTVTLEVADKVRVQLLRSHVSGAAPKPKAAGGSAEPKDAADKNDKNDKK